MNWRSHAACLDEDPELFFPAGETGSWLPQIQAAKSVCSGCPVRLECEVFAFSAELREGIWGGLTAEERRTIRRRMKAGTADGVETPGTSPETPMRLPSLTRTS